MKRTLAVIALVVVVTAAAVAALPWLLTPPLFGLQIAEAVERATGRTLTFAGRPQLTLWPELTLGLRQVELSNPPGMFEGRSVAIDTLRFHVSLGSLLWRQPEIEEIVALRPRFNLVVDSDGRSNFAPTPDDDTTDSGTPEAGDSTGLLPPIAIVDGEITYLNERAGRVLTLSNVELTVSQAGPESAVDLRGGFHWARQPIAVALYVKSPARLAADGSPSDMTLTSPLFSADFHGRAALADGLGLAGTLDFTTDSLGELVTAAGLAESLAPQLASLSLAGAIDFSRRTVRFKDAELDLGSTGAKGDLTVSFTGARPRVTGKLGIERVDLPSEPAPVGEDADEAIADWSALPIDLSVLSAFDGQVSLAASEVAYGTLATGPASLDVRLNAGRLDVTMDDTAVYGGTAAGRLMIDDSGPVPRFSAALRGRGIDGGKLAADLAGLAGIDGTADLDLDLAAMGLTPRELVGRLEGSGRISITDGAVGVDVAALLAGLEGGVVEDWTAAKGKTRFSTLQASFAVADGIAETDDLALEGPAARVSGSGSIDVLRQRVDLKLAPQVLAAAKTGAGAEALRSFPVPVVIDGFWSSPRLYPDIEGILEDPESAVKALRRKIKQASKLDLGADKIENTLKKAGRLPGRAHTMTGEKPPADSREATQ